MDFFLYIILFLSGIFAGFVNVLAGGGSMLTIPILTMFGLDISVANGTNRIGILLQNIVASIRFRQKKVLPLKYGIKLAVFSTLGAILGTFTVLNIDKGLLEKVIGAIFLILSVFMLYKPKVWEQGRKVKSNFLVAFLVFFVIGFYGGFIQAGVGFFLIMGLVLVEGNNILRANALKVFIVLSYTIFSLTIFILNDKVDFFKGIILALGTTIGANLGSKTAMKKGVKFIRIFVFIMVVFSAIRYLL